MQVVRKRWCEHLAAAGLLLGVSVPTLVIAAVVCGEWQNFPAQRGWLILGFGFYIAAALRALWSLFVQVCERMLYLRVELRRFVCPTLFESVTDALAKESERLGLTCSWDQEATQEHDKLTGDIAVKLRFWSSQARSMRVCVTLGGEHGGVRGKLDLQVQFSPGEDVVCGRDSRVERREVLVLSTRTSSEHALKDKALLTKWFEQCYKTYTQPEEGIVKVHALQESSTDWMPEWKFERVKPCKSASGTGQSFFLERDALGKVLADARLWSKSALRVYMITGPPGVGKSEFTIWLAGKLRLPVYRLCLSSPKLTDDRLAQLLSQTAVTHDSVLVQVDEFQGTMTRWLAGSTSSGCPGGITPGGFCECLQGSTAMGRGVVVLTGTTETSAEQARQMFPAVFRRIHCVAELSWMTVDDIRCYFHQFLMRFVSGCSTEEWDTWEAAFLQKTGPWASRPISVDMLKQFFMRQITESSCLGLGDFTSPAGASSDNMPTEFKVHDERRPDFFRLICDHGQAELFLNEYAPVHLQVVPAVRAC